MIEYIAKIYKWLETSGATFGDKTRLTMAEGLVTEEYNEFLKAVREEDDNELIDAFVDLVWVLANNTYFRGIPLENVERMFTLVAESNFSKFCNTELEASETVLEYADGNHFDKVGTKIETYYERVGDFYVVRRTDNNKVMKSRNYKSVSYLDLIA